ncbi:hypothetical protein L208DRAFT_1318635, partial [Tricholoma matsutake]
ISHFFMHVVFKSHILPGAGGVNSLKQRFEDIINSVRWPSHITRLPKNLGENQSLKNANEWRWLVTISPVVMWWLWKDSQGEISPGSPLIPANAKYIPQHFRVYRAIRCCFYSVLVFGCLHLVRFLFHTTINHHLFIHYYKFIKLFGPIYAWWLFGFEQFNGMLEKVVEWNLL